MGVKTPVLTDKREEHIKRSTPAHGSDINVLFASVSTNGAFPFKIRLSSADNFYHRNVDGTQTELVSLSFADNLRKGTLFSQDWSLDPHALRPTSFTPRASPHALAPPRTCTPTRLQAPKASSKRNGGGNHNSFDEINNKQYSSISFSYEEKIHPNGPYGSRHGLHRLLKR